MSIFPCRRFIRDRRGVCCRDRRSKVRHSLSRIPQMRYSFSDRYKWFPLFPLYLWPWVLVVSHSILMRVAVTCQPCNSGCSTTQSDHCSVPLTTSCVVTRRCHAVDRFLAEVKAADTSICSRHDERIQGCLLADGEQHPLPDRPLPCLCGFL